MAGVLGEKIQYLPLTRVEAVDHVLCPPGGCGADCRTDRRILQTFVLEESPEAPQPMVGDRSGRIPARRMPQGRSYRVRPRIRSQASATRSSGEVTETR